VERARQQNKKVKIFFIFFCLATFLFLKELIKDLCALCGDKKYFAGKWQDFTTR
jgi:hypothetical protein